MDALLEQYMLEKESRRRRCYNKYNNQKEKVRNRTENGRKIEVVYITHGMLIYPIPSMFNTFSVLAVSSFVIDPPTDDTYSV